MKVKHEGERYPLSLLFGIFLENQDPCEQFADMFASQTVQDADISWPLRKKLLKISRQVADGWMMDG